MWRRGSVSSIISGAGMGRSQRKPNLQSDSFLKRYDYLFRYSLFYEKFNTDDLILILQKLVGV